MTDWLNISFEDGVPENELELAVETFNNDAEGLVEGSTVVSCMGAVLSSSTCTYCYTYSNLCAFRPCQYSNFIGSTFFEEKKVIVITGSSAASSSSWAACKNFNQADISLTIKRYRHETS